jgi:hypothetical protein
MTLAMTMGAGLADNVDIYPAPPVTVADLGNLSQAYTAAHSAAVAAQATSHEAQVTAADAASLHAENCSGMSLRAKRGNPNWQLATGNYQLNSWH